MWKTDLSGVVSQRLKNMTLLLTFSQKVGRTLRNWKEKVLFVHLGL